MRVNTTPMKTDLSKVSLMLYEGLSGQGRISTRSPHTKMVFLNLNSTALNYTKSFRSGTMQKPCQHITLKKLFQIIVSNARSTL